MRNCFFLINHQFSSVFRVDKRFLRTKVADYFQALEEELNPSNNVRLRKEERGGQSHA